MAILDFSGATLDYDGTVDHNAQVSFSSSYYAWKTASGFIITALSSTDDITATAGGPTGGSVSTINVVGSAGEPIFSITGLDLPLIDLIRFNPANMLTQFWGQVLAGPTTIIMPQQAGIDITAYGDFYSGQSAHGAADLFTGTGVAASH